MNFRFPEMSKETSFLLSYLYPYKKKFDELNFIGCESRKVFVKNERGEYELIMNYNYGDYGFLHSIENFDKIKGGKESIKYTDSKIVRRKLGESITYHFRKDGFLEETIHEGTSRKKESYRFNTDQKGTLIGVNNLLVILEGGTTRVLDLKSGDYVIAWCEYDEDSNSIIYEDPDKVETKIELDNRGMILNKYSNSECVLQTKYEDPDVLVTYVKIDGAFVKSQTREYKVHGQKEEIITTCFEGYPARSVWKEVSIIRGI